MILTPCLLCCCPHTQYIERMKIDILENLRHLSHAPGLQFKEVGGVRCAAVMSCALQQVGRMHLCSLNHRGC
jgi:hypothetical protein